MTVGYKPFLEPMLINAMTDVGVSQDECIQEIIANINLKLNKDSDKVYAK